MKLVIIESPLKGNVPSWVPKILQSVFEKVLRAKNRAYAKKCMMDSLRRGEAPYASHLLFDQKGILNDADESERKLGMEAGFCWGRVPGLTRVFYLDRGFSNGMKLGEKEAKKLGQTTEYRYIE